MLLISRARFLSIESPQAQILVLCFNVALAAHLAATLQDCRNVQVHHFDGWAKRMGASRRGSQGRTEENHLFGERLKKHIRDGYGDARRFDAILIDEAQDFDGTWFECALEAMKDPNDGDLLIVGDRQQGIFGPRTVVWSRLGVNATGRTISAKFDLDKNYRNSREILELAARFAQDQADASNEDGFGNVAVDPAKSLRSNGIRPMLVGAADRKAENRKVVEIVKKLSGSGPTDAKFPRRLQPNEIGILYPRLVDRRVLDDLLLELQRVAPVVWLNDKDRTGGDSRTKVRESGIKLQTIHSAKGLQYPAVILIWADLLPKADEGKERIAEDAKLMYVALSRPEDYLFVTHTGSSEFVRVIETTGLAEMPR